MQLTNIDKQPHFWDLLLFILENHAPIQIFSITLSPEKSTFTVWHAAPAAVVGHPFFWSRSGIDSTSNSFCCSRGVWDQVEKRDGCGWHRSLCMLDTTGYNSCPKDSTQWIKHIKYMWAADLIWYKTQLTGCSYLVLHSRHVFLGSDLVLQCCACFWIAKCFTHDAYLVLGVFLQPKVDVFDKPGYATIWLSI